MRRNPNDSSLQAQIDELRTLLTANPLRSASVEEGRTRYYGGSELLIEDSNLSVVGTATVTGWLRVIGRIVLEGLGILTVNGLIELLGRMRVSGGGGIAVEGGGDVVVDGGEIRVGNVVLRDGKIFVGEGANQIVIDGATGEIIAGGMRINPGVNGGQIEFGDERTINAGSNYLGIYDGDRFVLFNEAGVTIYAAGSTISAGTDGIRAVGPGGDALTIDAGGTKLTPPSRSSLDDVIAWYGEDAEGYLIKVDPGIGGPGRSLSWPFPPSMVTSEYGPRDSPGEGASTFHEGLDFGATEGTPIPSAGSGVVEFAGDGGGYGNVVVVNHGGGLKTRYAHMQTVPVVAAGQTVSRGQILGPVGNTGVSFGAHLHFEVEVGGVKVNPRTKLPAA